MKPYYYVLNKTHGAPTFQHKTLEEATTEAERLAEKHPGTAFEILQCLGVSSVPKASTFWMDGAEPRSEAMSLDDWIDEAIENHKDYLDDYERLDEIERFGSHQENQCNYWKGRRDALTALKKSLE